MKFLTCSLPFVCTLTLIQATLATSGDVCPNSTEWDTVKVNSGVDASLFFNRSKNENDKDFRVYRAEKDTFQFAHMTKNQSNGICSGPLKDKCDKRKIEFRGGNQTHLLLVKIFKANVNDSGCYAVVVHFKSFSFKDDEGDWRYLKVIKVKVEDNSTETKTSPIPQWTQVYSTSSSSEIRPSPSQAYSPSSSPETRLSTSQVHSPSRSPGPSSSPDASQKNGLPWWGIAVIVVGILILVGVFVSCIIYKSRRERATNGQMLAHAKEGPDNEIEKIPLNEEAPDNEQIARI
ncbi:uncharacterized protein LOC111341751 isoform X2 [Stylophora pistillata]|uniref:uncharacterized protein LOC111341751 isoform X2 n=1 Tax=Stylophora pistillata TaxID=50429 RepID=UPI000C046BB2|nr:uncharacterized protein LOC111341751 isoform X2 [Stylophora pistillata]